jgi:hypothetical protein
MDGKRSALIVASYDYEDPGLRMLRAPARDAEALAGVLRDPQIGNFEVRTVLNEPAHLVNLAVEEFFAERGRDDLLVLHFSCHGLKDETGELYFATADTKLRRLGSTAVSAEFVNRLMSRSRSRRVVLLLDCCYAGAFERGMMARADKAVHIEAQFGGRGRAVITASGAMEYAFEDAELTASSELRPSIFTRALVEGLETGDADRDQDGQISLDELYDYVYDRVQDTTPNQTPGKWTFAIQGDLFIARRRGPVTTPSALPEGLQAAMEQPLAGIRLGAVHELERLLDGRHAGLTLAARLALEHLGEDDSRMVAAAAATVLQAHPAPGAVASQTRAPKVVVSPSAIDFGPIPVHSQPPPQTVDVHTTGGGGNLNARVAGTPDWVHAELTADRLIVTADPAVVGVLTGEVLVETDGGPATVRVTAHVQPRPRLVVDPSVVNFGRLQAGAPSPPRRIEVRNPGGGDLAWQFSSTGDFFQVRREPDGLIVWLRPVPGRHSGSVSIRSDAGDAVVPVTAELTAPHGGWPANGRWDRGRVANAPAGVDLQPAAGPRWWQRPLVWAALVIVAALVAAAVLVSRNGGTPGQSNSQLVQLGLVGSAVMEGDRVRLTSASIDQKGAAWSTDRKNVQRPFTATFQFRITDPGPEGGADGIAFVIQNNSDASLGINGGGMGYDDIPNSLAVEFDTSKTPKGTPPMKMLGDPSGHHIGVHSDGKDPNRADEKFRIGGIYDSPELQDGNPHTAVIKYASGRLNIYLDDLDRPVLVVPVDLAATLRLTDGTAWVGLTSATGKQAEQHEVWALSWQA